MNSMTGLPASSCSQIVELVKLLVFILVLNHIVACAWYGVGYFTMISGYDKNWLEDVGMTPVFREDMGWKYTTSLHWSITQFTPASMDISATNTGERIFSVFILFWALVALSSVIASVSGAMTVIRNMSGDTQKQFWLLRRYLKQREVSKNLTSRITKYLEHKFRAKMNVLPPGRVSYLGLMSEHLRAELSYETNRPLLEEGPFFGVLLEELTENHYQTMMYRICSEALKICELAQGDTQFFGEEVAKNMYFVKLGGFSYRGRLQTLPKKTFLSEACLWTNWTHRGDLSCSSEIGELISIPAKHFGEVLRSLPEPWELAYRYGQGFVKFMNSTDPSHLSDVTMGNLQLSLDPQESEPRFTVNPSGMSKVSQGIRSGKSMRTKTMAWD